MLANARMPGQRTHINYSFSFLQFDEENARAVFQYLQTRMTRQFLDRKPAKQPVWEECRNVEELSIVGGAWNSGVFPGLQFLNVDGPIP